jgi:N-hydroxyarylamine O-acetyltransferase
MSHPLDVTVYLNRIGLTESIRLDSAGLRRLQYSHLLRVPFENLDIHLGRPIQLDRSSLFRKIVVRRRGGFCYELNGLFAELLKSLEFRVTLLSARGAKREGGFGPEFDHLALRVDLDEPYLVDVGFGDAFLEPLRLLPDIEQSQPAKTFLLSRQGEDWLVHERKTGEPWKPLYLFTLAPRSIEEFADMCRYHQTSRASHFTHGTICSIARSTGRVTISGDRFIETYEGNRSERLIRNETQLRTLLRDHFGVIGIDHDLLPKTINA